MINNNENDGLPIASLEVTRHTGDMILEKIEITCSGRSTAEAIKGVQVLLNLTDYIRRQPRVEEEAAR